MENSALVVLNNFDKEVECRCKFIRSHSENLSINMLSALDLALMGIPEPVRKMPVKTLIEKYNGDIIKAAESFEHQEKAESAIPKKKKPIGVSPRAQNVTGTTRKSPAVPTTRLSKQSIKK